MKLLHIEKYAEASAALRKLIKTVKQIVLQISDKKIILK